ncbi:MAG: hypothetical protein HY869_17985 [Chloroflexi bacterium]|nr:hypothetical protein [Chloroflexota bacterium]
MNNQAAFPRNLRGLLTFGLAAGLVLTIPEIQRVFVPEPNWAKLLSAAGWATILAYLLLVIVGLTVLALSLWRPERIRPLAQRLTVLHWSLALALLGFLTWTYLFSPWQATLTGPWTQFLVAAIAARLLTWLFAPAQDQPFGWNELALAFSIFLYPRLVQEVRLYYPVSLATRGTLAAGLLFLFGLLGFLYTAWGHNLRVGLLKLRVRLDGFRGPLAVLILLTPLFLRYAIGPTDYILHYNIRFAVWLAALWAAAYLLCAEPGRLVALESLGIATGWLVLVSAVIRMMLLAVDNPFSLSWSEGNRLYDYSLVFAQDLYNYVGRIPDPYNTPGRYSLWGVLYLWRGLPISAHRLWNVVMLTVPSLLLAWAWTRRLPSVTWRRGLFLWISAFFILIAPLHPPFMLMAAIVALFAFHPSPYVRGASLIAASLYAGISRWTWVLAPGAWGALTDLLLYYPKREGNWFKRLLPTGLMAALGAVPGLIISFGSFASYTSGSVSTANQPLLWYRLLPNPTLGLGIVLLTIMTTAPLFALLAYRLSTRPLRLDGFQALALWGALLGFLGAGMVISTKIGGGGDLHNLDMYIGTLIAAVMLGLASQAKLPEMKAWPAWALAALCFLALLPVHPFTPFHPSAGYHSRLDLPAQGDMDQALLEIQAAVNDFSQRGEVLFMDQRQLLTFGYVNAVPFVPEYEKKYMMDQAMASNAAYFQPYYRDLAAGRFALIVTEPLKVVLKTDGGVFSEENDLWVAWVSAPTLCFYEPIMDDRTVGVMMLVPRKNPVGCEQYLK